MYISADPLTFVGNNFYQHILFEYFYQESKDPKNNTVSECFYFNCPSATKEPKLNQWIKKWSASQFHHAVSFYFWLSQLTIPRIAPTTVRGPHTVTLDIITVGCDLGTNFNKTGSCRKTECHGRINANCDALGRISGRPEWLRATARSRMMGLGTLRASEDAPEIGPLGWEGFFIVELAFDCDHSLLNQRNFTWVWICNNFLPQKQKTLLQ